MKQFIVLISTIMLGLFIYDIIAGPGDDTIVSNLTTMWQHELSERSYSDR